MAGTSNFQVLRQAVIDVSTADRWKSALLEWEVTSVEEHPTSDGECVCGQTNLLWMYTITNTGTGQELFPIGSSCVNHFGRTDLNQQVAVFQKLVDLRNAARAGERITVATEHFSRAVIDYLYESGAFTPDQYNHFDGWNDWHFLRTMFGRRDKSTIEARHRWRAKKLIELKVIPFVLADERLR